MVSSVLPIGIAGYCRISRVITRHHRAVRQASDKGAEMNTPTETLPLIGGPHDGAEATIVTGSVFLCLSVDPEAVVVTDWRSAYGRTAARLGGRPCLWFSGYACPTEAAGGTVAR